jgi:hypothetical protein
VLLHAERHVPTESGPALGSVLVAVRRVLSDLLDIPGAVHACAIDPSGLPVADVGTPDRTAEIEAVLSWMPRTFRSCGSSLDDLVVTTADHYHVLRRFPVASRTLLVHVVLERTRGNLALARHMLAADGFRTRLDAAGRGLTSSGQPKSVWVGGTRRAPARVAAGRPSSAPRPHRGREVADSWLVLASLLAEKADEPQADEQASAA